MKTVEEVAWQIIHEGLDPDWEAIDMKKITAIIRADREAVLRRVEDVLCSGNYEAIGAYQKLVQEVIRYLIDAVKKEALK